jgi:hypothetical protein
MPALSSKDILTSPSFLVIPAQAGIRTRCFFPAFIAGIIVPQNPVYEEPFSPVCNNPLATAVCLCRNKAGIGKDIAMKTKVLITSLAVLFLGSLMLYAEEDGKPAPAPQDKPPAGAPRQGQRLNQQQRLERWMTQLNNAYEAKDYQKVDRLIRQYANAGRNRPGPAAGQRQMQQRRMGQQDRPLAHRQGPGRWQDQNLPDRPRAQADRPRQGPPMAMAPRQGQPFRYGRGMGQQQGPHRPMPYAREGGFRMQLRRWADNHPQEFKQFINRHFGHPGRWNQEANVGPQRNRPNPGYWRNFWADEF